jgi:DNA-binding LacI/PurR family transcriptional regulator
VAKIKKIRNIGDLAEIAGVSPGTVSRALSGKGLLSAETRERIRALAEEHGFQPSALARNLRTQRTGAIGVVIPLGHERGQHISDPFFMTMLGHLADSLTESGYDLVLSRVIPDSGAWLERIIDSGRTDGLIVIGQSDQAKVLDQVAVRHKKFVVWGGYTRGQVHCSVGSDNFLGGSLATQHLIDRGCKSFAFFGDPRALEIEQRLEGCKAALHSAGLEQRLTIVPTHLSPEEGGSDIASYLRDGVRPNGIIAASDVIAMNALRILAEQHIAVPGDVRVVGYDDLPLAGQTVPQLTTIRQDIAAGARYLVDNLLRRIAGEDTASVVMKPELIVRMSS